jgi:hypothetical protein
MDDDDESVTVARTRTCNTEEMDDDMLDETVMVLPVAQDASFAVQQVSNDQP